MIIEACCLLLTLISLNISDLIQTSEFTATPGHYERNPLARPLVDGGSSVGEILLAIGSVSLIVSIEQLEFGKQTTWTLVKLTWIAGHAYAVHSNQKLGYEIPAIVFPLVIVRF